MRRDPPQHPVGAFRPFDRQHMAVARRRRPGRYRRPKASEKIEAEPMIGPVVIAPGMPCPSAAGGARRPGASSWAPTTCSPRSSSSITAPRSTWSSPRAMTSLTSCTVAQKRVGAEQAPRSRDGARRPPGTTASRLPFFEACCMMRLRGREDRRSRGRARRSSAAAKPRNAMTRHILPGCSRCLHELEREAARPRRGSPPGPLRRWHRHQPSVTDPAACRSRGPALADEIEDFVDERMRRELGRHVLDPLRQACLHRQRAGDRRGGCRGSARGRSRAASSRRC